MLECTALKTVDLGRLGLYPRSTRILFQDVLLSCLLSQIGSSDESKEKSRKKAWDEEQDNKLLGMIAEIGPHQWEQMAATMEGRSGKQCRERWHNQLNPLLKKTAWSVEEDWILYILHETVKNRWAEITNVLLGRSDNSIKNYWNSTLSHKQAELE